MIRVADFHTHVLPAMDDGSRSVEQSIEMLKAEAEQGIGCVVATPHFYPAYDHPEAFLEKRSTAEKILRDEMTRYADLPSLVVGAEVHYYAGISDSEWLQRLTIAKSRYILIEMPQCRWTESMYRELEDIWKKQQLIPIIAHIDRYISPLKSHGIPQRLNVMHVVVQANAGFFLRTATAGIAMRMLRRDQIQLLGSDCHNMSDRKPNLGAAWSRIENRLQSDELERIVEYQNEVLEDKLLQYRTSSYTGNI